MRADTPRVLSIGIDSPNHLLFLEWLEKGHLPHIEALRKQSLHLDIHSKKRFNNEYCWIPFLTGQSVEKGQYALDVWDAQLYAFNEASIFDWLKAPVFYANNDAIRTIVFDLTAPVVEGVNGIQVTGWASELDECYPGSNPQGLFDELLARYGPDPKLAESHTIHNGLSGNHGISFSVPSLYQADKMAWLVAAQIESIKRRAEACIDLMAEEPWDLFLTAFFETHTAGHMFWHLSQQHPLGALRSGDDDPLLRIFQAMDEAVGRMLEAVGDSASVVLYTIDQVVPDCLENARAMLLPEFMYRWNFPGKAALAVGDAETEPPEPCFYYRDHWKHEIWALRTEHGEEELQSPGVQESLEHPKSWCPANWYAPVWPRMKAFAMPSVSDGYVRLNVVGRESQGLVEPEEFLTVCEKLAEDLHTMINPRTGKRIVRAVLQVRRSPFDIDPKDHPADLIVVFHEDTPVDVLDSPVAGRIGPIPYFRSGSHQSYESLLENLMLVRAPHVAPGRAKKPIRLEDISATILTLLNQPLPPAMDGVPHVPAS